MMTRTCTKCSRTLSVDNFTYRPDQGRHIAQCKDCVAEYHKQYYQQHREGRQDRRRLVNGMVQCKMCKQYLPPTTEYFWKKKSGLAGTTTICKECVGAKRRAAYIRKRVLVDGKKQCTQCKQWMPADTKYFSRNKMGWLGLQPECKGCVSQRTRMWSQTPSGKLSRQTSRNNYYARLRAAKGTVTPEEIHELFNKQDGLCFYCHKDLHNEPYQIDHYIPISKGGTNTIDNVRVACRKCNSSKRDKLPSDWSVS